MTTLRRTLGATGVLAGLLAAPSLRAEAVGTITPTAETLATTTAEAPDTLALTGTTTLASPVTTGTTAPDLGPEMDIVEGGAHWRIETVRGPIHVWRPAGFLAPSAGVVVYVHGYHNTADEAWISHRLASQFRASGRNALFVVPEAPIDGNDSVRWPSLSELIDAACAAPGIEVPSGPVVAIGHSGAFRTVEEWLGEPKLHEIILLDGLYKEAWPYRTWLDQRVASMPRRLTLVGHDTRRRCRRLAGEMRGAVRLSYVPAHPGGLGRRARDARLLVMDSQYAHMALVTGGRVIPLLLELSGLMRL
jgi:hypothetical protein